MSYDESSVGSEQSPLPQRILGLDLFRVLTALGAMRKPVDGRIEAYAAAGPSAPARAVAA